MRGCPVGSLQRVPVFRGGPGFDQIPPDSCYRRQFNRRHSNTFGVRRVHNPKNGLNPAARRQRGRVNQTPRRICSQPNMLSLHNRHSLTSFLLSHYSRQNRFQQEPRTTRTLRLPCPPDSSHYCRTATLYYVLCSQVIGCPCDSVFSVVETDFSREKAGTRTSRPRTERDRIATSHNAGSPAMTQEGHQRRFQCLPGCARSSRDPVSMVGLIPLAVHFTRYALIRGIHGGASTQSSPDKSGMFRTQELRLQPQPLLMARPTVT